MTGLKTFARRAGIVLLFATIALCVAIVVIPRFLDRIYYKGAESGHFDGARFFNPDGEDTAAPPAGGSRFGFFMRFLTQSDGRPPWPASVAVSRPGATVDLSDPNAMFATWVGHATMLVQTQGLNILTDPVWSAKAGPLGLGPRRVIEPGIAFEALPKIDIVLVSHNHYDHMDLATLKRLWDRDKPLIVTSLGNATLMRDAGIEAVARDWGGRVRVRPGIDVIVTRNHHWSSRWFVDRNRALWSSFVVTLPGGNLSFAGDTGLGDGEWADDAASYGPVRLALIPIGAFRFVPGQMGTGSHIGPIDAADVFARTRASRAIAIHWGTFRLSYEAYDTPPRLLAAVMKCRGETGFDVAAIGRPIRVPVFAMRPRAAIDRAAVVRCLDTPAVRALQ